MDAMGNCRCVNVLVRVGVARGDLKHLAAGATPDTAQHGQQIPVAEISLSAVLQLLKPCGQRLSPVMQEQNTHQFLNAAPKP